MRSPFVHMPTCSLALLLLAACPGGSSGDEAAAESTTHQDPTSSERSGCDCIVDEDPVDLNSAPSGPTCGEEICPVVTGECEAPCGDGAFALDDPTAIECALTALRDRTPGLLRWDVSEPAHYEGYVLIHEDGTVVRRGWAREDLTFTVSKAIHGDPWPVDYYETCMADDDDSRFNCLATALEVVHSTCDEGWACEECI